MSLMGGVIWLSLVFSSSGVREVEATSCEVIRVNLGLGMTTQIVLEQAPEVTLYADKRHFKITTNSSAPRSLAVIPFVSGSEIDVFRNSEGKLPSPKALAEALDQSFRTNLFVFFKNNNQLMFELRFVEKNRADFILKVKQVFREGCNL